MARSSSAYMISNPRRRTEAERMSFSSFLLISAEKSGLACRVLPGDQASNGSGHIPDELLLRAQRTVTSRRVSIITKQPQLKCQARIEFLKVFVSACVEEFELGIKPTYYSTPEAVT
ncbi:hypothetical protein RRG08_047809 [Elysia crispata]|uniref:Uncharacterized protein n=1 Tax=Elysia crispata TaxID=231223 RepID=A0AAE1CRL0_9GAST|nr:hypothetical protein RRG08_047809 [Elysia crispata]